MDGLSSLFAESGADPRVDRDGMQGQGQEMVLKDPKLEVVEQRLSMAIQSVTGIGAGNDRLLLVLDGIDLLLAATDTDAQSVTDMLAELRMVRYLTRSFNIVYSISERSKMLTATYSSMSILQSSPSRPTTHSLSPPVHHSRPTMPPS